MFDFHIQFVFLESRLQSVRCMPPWLRMDRSAKSGFMRRIDIARCCRPYDLCPNSFFTQNFALGRHSHTALAFFPDPPTTLAGGCDDQNIPKIQGDYRLTTPWESQQTLIAKPEWEHQTCTQSAEGVQIISIVDTCAHPRMARFVLACSQG